MVTWLPGRPPGVPVDDDLVDDLVGFVRALRAVETPDAPVRTPAQRGDLLPGNLLVEEGRRAVIDWGGFGLADPALDLMPAWNAMDELASPASARVSASTTSPGPAAAAGPLQQAVLALPYYWDTNPGMVAQVLYALEQLLSPSSRPW